ncbi:MAG: hypothetical protein DCC55_19295 [Chloroflexi bacterium]|nr:MAG: hypothetical protein DCC55_19295 [Chloroflexota bacterium]
MTPRFPVLIAVALAVAFWLTLIFGEPSAFAQPDDPGDDPVAGAAQLQQEQPVLTIETSGSITAGIPAVFTATVTIDQDTYTYTWAFGDGSTAQGRVTPHIFQNAGNFRVGVIAVRNDERLEASVDIFVSEDSILPVGIEGLECDDTGPVEANNPVQLIASVARGRPVSYSWTLGYPGSPRLDGAVVTHRYPAPGHYRATVTARNPMFNQSNTCTTDIVVLDETIAGLDFTWVGTPRLGVPLQFEVKKDRGTRVSFEWFFGDGGHEFSERPQHSFQRLGFYEVTVVASNSRNTLRRTRTLMVVPPPPRVISGSNNGPKPVNTLLTANVSVEREDLITAFTWRWGDGTPPDITSVPVASHQYASAGVYGIHVIARNDGGAATHSQIAYIGNGSPLSTLLITHNFSSDLMASVGQPVTLTAIFSPPLPNAKYEDYEYLWDWGDRTSDRSRTPTLGHAYRYSNNFVVQVAATRTVTADTPLHLYGATVVLVAPNIHLPLLARNSWFTAASPFDRPSAPTPTSSPTPEATETSELVETEEPPATSVEAPSPSPSPVEETPSPLPPPVAETPSPTPTTTAINPTPIPPTAPPTPTETELPTPTATPTQTPVEGGTIPPLPG